MPRPRFQNLDPARQQLILRVAGDEFAAHGYERASLNRILQSASISKGSFYYYFDDKADLFHTVMHALVEEQLGAVKSLGLSFSMLHAENFWPELKRWMHLAAPLAENNPDLGGLGKLIYEPPPVEGFSETVAELFGTVYGWLSQLVELGRQLGAVRTDQPLGLQQQMIIGILQAADRWFVDQWSSLDDDERARLSDSVFDSVERLLASEASAGETVNGEVSEAVAPSHA